MIHITTIIMMVITGTALGIGGLAIGTDIEADLIAGIVDITAGAEDQADAPEEDQFLIRAEEQEAVAPDQFPDRAEAPEAALVVVAVEEEEAENNSTQFAKSSAETHHES